MTTAVQTQNDVAIAALNGAVGGLTAEEISEELDGATPRYSQVKIPSGGGIAFEVPGEDPESPDIKKDITGIIVWHHGANAYWANKGDTTDAAPDCSSIDGKTGIRNADYANAFGEGLSCSCATCPLNQFGSGEGGKGKACKNMKRLYILTDESLFPYCLTLPPTSLGAFTDYVTMNLSRGRKVCDVITQITLAKRENKTGQSYSVAVFKALGELSEENRQASRNYRETIKAFVQRGQDVAQELGGATVDMETGEIID